MAQWLYQTKPDINISALNEFALSKACSYGHLVVAQWLYKIKPDINISALNEVAFRLACKYGNLDVAQWLYEIKPNINIGANYDHAFRYACKNNHLNVAQWLCQIKPEIYISGMHVVAFLETCYHGNLDVAQWLYEIRPNINIGFCDDAFKLACERSHLHIAQWLCNLHLRYHFEIHDYHIINWQIIPIPIDESKNIYITEMCLCPICNDSKSNIQTNCSHSYCLDCIKIWYKKSSKCPMCRQQITNMYVLINKKFIKNNNIKFIKKNYHRWDEI
jgi:hypothetical protein